MNVTYTIKGKREIGKVVKANTKTVWVVARDGTVVKRHRVKHGVVVS